MAIGRVVDDSIVVIENIKRHYSLGEVGTDGIMRAVREVAGAVTSSTLTTVAVFLPIGLVSGQAGELFRPFAVTVTIALLASLLVALTVVPVFAWWFLQPPQPVGGAATEAPPADSPATELLPTGFPAAQAAATAPVPTALVATARPTAAENAEAVSDADPAARHTEGRSLARGHESPRTRLQRA